MRALLLAAVLTVPLATMASAQEFRIGPRVAPGIRPGQSAPVLPSPTLRTPGGYYGGGAVARPPVAPRPPVAGGGGYYGGRPPGGPGYAYGRRPAYGGGYYGGGYYGGGNGWGAGAAIVGGVIGGIIGGALAAPPPAYGAPIEAPAFAPPPAYGGPACIQGTRRVFDEAYGRYVYVPYTNCY